MRHFEQNCETCIVTVKRTCSYHNKPQVLLNQPVKLTENLRIKTLNQTFKIKLKFLYALPHVA